MKILNDMNDKKHSDAKLADQCIWALGNISGDSKELRNHLMKLKLLDVILAVAEV
jgi:hypothetical protein